MSIPAFRSTILIVYGLFVALALPQGEQRADRTHEMAVNGVGEARFISMSVTIANDLDSQVVMPSCGNILEEYVVCFPPAFLEQYDGSVWKRVSDKSDHLYGELAAPPLVTINPGASVRVRADFPPDTYEWKPDQPVRLVIPLWPASDKTRAPANRIRYVSPPLQPPSVGRLAFEPQ